jgi:hypothetical protein
MASIQMKFVARATEVLEQLGANTASEGSKEYGFLKVFYLMPVGYLIQLESVLMGLDRSLHVLV